MKDQLQDLAKIIILSDRDTWETVNDSCTVAFLTWEGEGHIMDGGKIDTINDDHIVTEIDLKELVRCWLDRT